VNPSQQLHPSAESIRRLTHRYRRLYEQRANFNGSGSMWFFGAAGFGVDCRVGCHMMGFENCRCCAV
jgi:hypothetical protein